MNSRSRRHRPPGSAATSRAIRGVAFPASGDPYASSSARSALPRAIWRGDPDGALLRVLLAALRLARLDGDISRAGAPA